MTAADLVRLRDIGPVSLEGSPSIFTMSPDKRHIAFQVREADPESNSYHLAMMVMAVRPGASPLRVDEGGEIILKTISGTGGVTVGTGIPATITPMWATDGRALFFLKKTNGKTQIWRAAADGSGSKAITAETGDIKDFTLTADGTRLLYATSRSDPAKVAALNQEALAGYRYDARFVPLFSSEPVMASRTGMSIVAVDPSSGRALPPSPADTELLDRSRQSMQSVTSKDGRRAWVSPSPGALPGTRTDLHVALDGPGSPIIADCAARTCSNAGPIWWTADGKRLRYLRREGWGDSETALYEWKPGPSAPNELYATEDLLIDCQPLEDRLICAREKSATPRQLVLLDPASGRDALLYDPNPAFAAHALGRTERLHWRNDFGLEIFGDLVYPVGYVPGRRYPLIVVQYTSRGFLRGGTGDEFPVQPFANREYAVLSVQRPSTTKLFPDAKDVMELEARGLAGFMDRRSVLSAIERQVQALIQRGIVDSAKVGITGLSDGSSTVQFAALNSNMFRAGSVSACCWDPYQDAIMGLSVTQAYHQAGWPLLLNDNDPFWSSISLMKNARRVALPLLMQQSDDEFRGALASYTALRQAGKPTALFVFPGEYHVKWQPAHRLAAYNRNLDWFDYWLRGIGDGRQWEVEPVSNRKP